MTNVGEDDPVLLYDGLCPLCNRAVRAVIRHDPAARIRYASLEGSFARRVIEAHPELHGVDTMMFVTRDGNDRQTVRVKSEAALAVAKELGWSAVTHLARIPRPLRDAIYDAVAAVRYRTFGRYGECPVPARDVRDRFID